MFKCQKYEIYINLKFCLKYHYGLNNNISIMINFSFTQPVIQLKGSDKIKNYDYKYNKI